MTPDIKICGIKNIEEIKIINKYPVSYVGFIFADSKRKVTEDKVIELSKHIREDIKVVGVFVNENVEYVNRLVHSCRLDIVQLHGNESNEYCKNICCKVWKSIAVSDESSIRIIDYYKDVDGILLDTYHNGKSGGTGKAFSWELVKKISKSNQIVLAGGLTPDNIVKAINIVKPQIIDVNSGVETNFNKNENKIRQLFIRLQEYRRKNE
ncbi:phosphoribosylanthranilate isomerase [Vallitalea sp.]|jgi:phosphoribosylanthranilate isomerase|uniref:phosphoribosylanthranilate isomerase n=1 Tax=Vallitalea sp. TaxID=1882829 RepID=UPI0025EC88E0|nr:phosphoribosylanthranilate isomerase [Vallitalea sp.]MCT4687603.1 phosphoribosylanthranilate isomerase [Vallitalea sp.]